MNGNIQRTKCNTGKRIRKLKQSFGGYEGYKGKDEHGEYYEGGEEAEGYEAAISMPP